MILRKLWSWERERHRAHLLRLGPEDRRLRFGGAVRDERIHRYCDQIDRGRSTVVGVFLDGTLRGVAELMRIPGGVPAGAEIALSVERDFQRRGLGDMLMRKTLLLARNRFIDTVYLVTLSENAPMLHLAGKFGAVSQAIPSSGESRIRLPWPSYLSVLEEMREDGTALVGAILEPPVEDLWSPPLEQRHAS